jgi:hypothetical protein
MLSVVYNQTSFGVLSKFDLYTLTNFRTVEGKMSCKLKSKLRKWRREDDLSVQTRLNGVARRMLDKSENFSQCSSISLLCSIPRTKTKKSFHIVKRLSIQGETQQYAR